MQGGWLIKIEYSISPGWADIKYGNLSEKAKTLVDSFFVGICMIADDAGERLLGELVTLGLGPLADGLAGAQDRRSAHRCFHKESPSFQL